MARTPNERASTARPGASVFHSWALGEGSSVQRVLNLGSGYTSAGGSALVVSLDHDWEVLGGGAADVTADVSGLPFRSGTFDRIVFKDVLEHVGTPIAALREARRVATSEAVAVVTVPRAIPRAVWADPTHLRGYTRRSLALSLTQAGWRPERGPVRFGSVPGAGWLGLSVELQQRICAIPAVGHRFGTNWLVVARAI